MVRENVRIFAAVLKLRVMTAIQLNAALFRELNVIVTDEELMEKAIKALRRITSKRRRVMSARKSEEAIDLPTDFLDLRGCVSLTPDEIASDDRLAYLHRK